MKFFSTSPFAEHDDFAKNSKELFKFVAYKDPKQIFKDEKSILLPTGVTLGNNNNSNDEKSNI